MYQPLSTGGSLPATTPTFGQPIAIIGVTGRTGKWALRAALQRDISVRVLVRSPGKVETTLKDVFPGREEVADLLAQVTIVEGDVTDTAKVAYLCKDTEVVMSFLGMVKPPEWIVKPGVDAIMAALKTLDKPPKFISMSSIGLGNSRPQADKAWGLCGCGAKIMIDHFLKECFQDMQAAEDVMLANADSRLTIIIARATVLSDKNGYYKDYAKQERDYRLLKEDELSNLVMYIDRQHVAEAMLDMCEPGTWDNTQPSVFGL